MKNKLCADCNKLSRLNNKSYCKDCYRLRNRANILLHSEEPCSRCGNGARVEGTYYCAPCNNKQRQKTIKNHENEPCARCCLAPRAIGNLYCLNCSNIAANFSITRNQDELCSLCHTEPRGIGSCHCAACALDTTNKSVALNQNILCRSCGIKPRNHNQTLCTRCSYIECIWNKYKITFEEYGQYLINQSGLCALCLKPLLGKKDPVVDHDHRTNKVRGLLHNCCNLAFGLLRENPDNFKYGEEYASKHWKSI